MFPAWSDHGHPPIFVLYGGGKADVADVRMALERMKEAPDNWWRGTVDALAAYLLDEL